MLQRWLNRLFLPAYTATLVELEVRDVGNECKLESKERPRQRTAARGDHPGRDGDANSTWNFEVGIVRSRAWSN